jgi:hypothetical protein
LTAAAGTIPALPTSAQADHTLGRSHPGIDKGEQHHPMRVKLRWRLDLTAARVAI